MTTYCCPLKCPGGRGAFDLFYCRFTFNYQQADSEIKKGLGGIIRVHHSSASFEFEFLFGVEGELGLQEHVLIGHEADTHTGGLSLRIAHFVLVLGIAVPDRVRIIEETPHDQANRQYETLHQGFECWQKLARCIRRLRITGHRVQRKEILSLEVAVLVDLGESCSHSPEVTDFKLFETSGSQLCPDIDGQDEQGGCHWTRVVSNKVVEELVEVGFLSEILDELLMRDPRGRGNPGFYERLGAVLTAVGVCTREELVGRLDWERCGQGRHEFSRFLQNESYCFNMLGQEILLEADLLLRVVFWLLLVEAKVAEELLIVRACFLPFDCLLGMATDLRLIRVQTPLQLPHLLQEIVI